MTKICSFLYLYFVELHDRKYVILAMFSWIIQTLFWKHFII